MFNYLIARLSLSPICKRGTQLGFLHRYASPIFNSFSSVVKLSESAQPNQKQNGNESLTVSYLVSSCGLSPKVAIRASQRVKLKDPDKADLVLNLFRSYGLSETQISKVVRNCPQLLLLNPEMKLAPKLRFFLSIGFTSSELPGLLSSGSVLLSRSLEKYLIPLYDALKSVVNDDDIVRTAIKCSSWGFHQFHIEDLVANLKVLREYGVPQSSVSRMLTRFPRIALMKHAKFVECVKFAKETGSEPFKVTFILAISIFSTMKKSTWESKMDIFERCGMPREVTLLAFSNFPICMLLSEKKITNAMKFLQNEMHLPLEEIAISSPLLGYSLDRRIIPRWSVVKILKMNGLLKKNMPRVTSIIKLSEKKFLENFVIRFQESVPELLNIYKDSVSSGPEVQ